ncbi:MAG: hypothetical protein PHV30_05415 [Candidatus Margulisbacteria bacterium]|nr:hypothetical protein [Candidatus Margulisiibacteriota bacterium]
MMSSSQNDFKIDVDDIINGFFNATEKTDNLPAEEEAEAPVSIKVKDGLSLNKGYMYHLADLLEGFDPNITDLRVKLSGNCVYFPYNGNKSIMASENPQDVHFRVGSNGKVHKVIIPAASN